MLYEHYPIEYYSAFHCVKPQKCVFCLVTDYFDKSGEIKYKYSLTLKGGASNLMLITAQIGYD